MRFLLSSLAESPDPARDAGWRAGIKRRVLLVASLLAVWTVVIFGRLVHLHVVQHDFMRARADSQQHDVIEIPAARGEIVDRDGEILAYSVESADIQAHPKQVKNVTLTVDRLCQALRDCSPAERARLVRELGSKALYVMVRKARTLTPGQIEAVRALELSSVALMPQNLRYYPKKELAAHLLGFVGTDNTGLGGIEARRDSDILGRKGRVLVQRDAKQRNIVTRVDQAPTAGATIELTIDLALQHIVERELRAGVLAARAQAGTAVMMNPATGEILALANFPTFNPNSYGAVPEALWRNRAVQEGYEPGSTFKIVTVAAAIEDGVYVPSDLIDTNPGWIKFPGRKIIDEAKGHNYGVLTVEDMFIRSSNIGAIRAGLRVGAERMARFSRQFGFGQALAPDFRGESPGLVHAPDRMSDSDLASLSMGYNVLITPVQMAAAVSAVANGGLLYQPHLVRATIKDGVRTEAEPRQLRRAIEPRTAATLTAMMEGVVERGTAKAAQVPRYQVAGKTGTAQKVVNGAYSDSEYNASFVGFVPSRRPTFTILVVIDSPQGGHYGGAIAAPIFQRIAAAALRHAGVPPSIDPMPTVIVADAARGARPEPIRATTLPVVQHAGGRTLMPDVRGLSARQALRLLGAAGLWAEIEGDGVVTVQSPDAGEPIDPGGWGRLTLRRTPPAFAPGGGR